MRETHPSNIHSCFLAWQDHLKQDLCSQFCQFRFKCYASEFLFFSLLTLLGAIFFLLLSLLPSTSQTHFLQLFDPVFGLSSIWSKLSIVPLFGLSWFRWYWDLFFLFAKWPVFWHSGAVLGYSKGKLSHQIVWKWSSSRRQISHFGFTSLVAVKPVISATGRKMIALIKVLHFRGDLSYSFKDLHSLPCGLLWYIEDHPPAGLVWQNKMWKRHFFSVTVHLFDSWAVPRSEHAAQQQQFVTSSDEERDSQCIFLISWDYFWFCLVNKFLVIVC